jgi:alpha-glucosidase (family GH31 glycosyl hydrolase)
MWHVWETREKCTRFWWESPKERDHLEDQGVDGIRIDLKEIGWGVWIGFD